MIRSYITSIFRTTLLAATGTVLLSCGGGSGDTPDPDPVPDPLAAVLELPANNEVCYDGTVISASMSEVAFSWQPSEHTDRYQLQVTNLDTQTSNTYPANSTSINVSLERGVPYAWRVTSQADNTSAEAVSDTWRFYLAGEGVSSYAPFPAELNSPASGSTVNPASVNFEWTGGDADSQELSYEIYVDTTDGRTTLQASSLTETSYEMLNLEAGTVYYWSVTTIDADGNRADSPAYSFKTQ